MRPQAFSVIALSSVFFGIFSVLASNGCGGANVAGDPATTPNGSVNGALDASSDSANDATLASDAGTVGQLFADGGKLCGCSLCAPVVSDDACTTDNDCLPEVPCHAAKCVGKAKATPRAAGQMCTEIMMCGTTDANGCGCVKGKCTLSPRGS